MFSFFKRALGFNRRALSQFRKKNPIKLPPIDDVIRELIVSDCRIRSVSDRYQVTIYNDDVTPMEFVIELLEAYLFYSTAEAMDKMIQIHKTGSAAVYVSSQSIVSQVSDYLQYSAQQHGYPLKCSVREH